MRKNICLVLTISICVLNLIQGCKRKNPLEFDNLGISYQIYSGYSNILIVRNTNGEGARKLQLYNSKAQLIEEVIMHNEPFQIDKWDGKTIEIKYYTSDLRFFKPWFEDNKFKPRKIGRFKLKYTYEVDAGGWSKMIRNIDSFKLNFSENLAYLYYKNSLVDKFPITKLLVRENKLVFMDFQNKKALHYCAVNRDLIVAYLDDIFGKAEVN